MSFDDRHWYALRVRSNFESVVSAVLRGRGYEEFLPTYAKRTQDGSKSFDCPLFPGYLFCRLDITKRLPVLMTPGAVSFVGLGRVPVPIANEEIDAVREMTRAKLVLAPWPYLKAGERVLIKGGPLAGVEAILVETKGSWRAVVSIELLQRSVIAEVNASWIHPVGNHLAFRQNAGSSR